jgi:hypothetical protein
MENRPFYNQYIVPILYPNGKPAEVNKVETPAPKVEVKVAPKVQPKAQPKVEVKPKPTATKETKTNNIFTDFTSVVSNNVSNNITNATNTVTEGISNIVENVSNNVSNVASTIKNNVISNLVMSGVAIEDLQKWGNSLPEVLDRAAVMFLGTTPTHTEIVKSAPVKVNATVANTPSNTKRKTFAVTPTYKEFATTTDGYMSYINIFDNNKGFDYVPTARLNEAGTYKNVEGMAHFLFDFDMTTGIAVNDPPSNSLYLHNHIKYNKDGSVDQKSLASTKAYQPGSTVTDPYFTTYTKNANGTVNIKYKKASEVGGTDKIGDSLRQYRFTDIDWAGKGGKAVGFKGTGPRAIAALYTKSGSPTYFIYPVATGKDSYGKFGGNSVIFLIDDTNVAIDFAGSANQIKQQGDAIVKQFNIKPEQLIIAYHDVGSYSAKIQDENGTIDSRRYYGFNTNKQTGAGLAFPKK